MIAATKRLGSNHRTAAAWNRGLTLRLLREHDTLSRRQISQMTGLRGSTLTYIVRELLEKDVVRTVGKLDSKRVGQKQVLLKINPALGWTLGVSLRPNTARLVLLDAAGGRIAGQQLELDAHRLDIVPDQIATALDTWLDGIGRPPGRMLGLGLGLPGVIDAERGVVLRSTLFDATNVPLREMLHQRLAVPTVIDHDACYGACAEAMDGAARAVTHFVYFLVNHIMDGEVVRFSSYGSALYLEGKVYRGAHYGAGELATTLAPEVVETDRAGLERLGREEGELPGDLSKLAAGVGRALASIINFIDLQMVVLGGTAGVRNREFLRVVQDVVDSTLIPVPGRRVSVVVNGIAAEAVARGAAIAATDAALVEGGLSVGE